MPIDPQQQTTPSPINANYAAGCLVPISAFLGLYQIIFASRVLHLSEIFTGSSAIAVPLHVVTSILWGVIFLWGSVLVARRNQSALPYMGWAIIAFVMYNLLRILLFVRADYDQERLPFLILIALAGLAIPVISLLSKEKQRLD